MIRLKGEDTDSALRDWVKKEISEAPIRAYDLGKFLFSVSVATAGLFVTLERLTGTKNIDKLLGLSLFFFFISVFIALFMAIPKRWEVSSSDDLFEVHNKKVKSSVSKIYWWFGFWGLGVFVGYLAL